MKQLKRDVEALVGKLRDPRAIDALGIAVVAVMTAAVFLLAIDPALEHRHELQQRHEQLVEEQRHAAALARHAQDLRRRLDATQRMVERNPMRLESLRALNRRLSQMTELASDSGLRIEQIQPGRDIPGEHYHTVPIKLVGRGEFGASTRFLHRLHESFPDVAIASMSLTGQPERARAADAPGFDLTLLWYAAPPPERG